MAEVDTRNIIRYPLISEDAVSLIERENKITFIVDLKANRTQVKRAIEELYNVKVEKVNLSITPSGQKKVYAKLTPEFKAADLAVKLGIL